MGTLDFSMGTYKTMYFIPIGWGKHVDHWSLTSGYKRKGLL